MADEIKLVENMGEIEHIILGFMILRKGKVEFNVNFLLADTRTGRYATVMQRYRSLTSRLTAKTNTGISVTAKKKSNPENFVSLSPTEWLSFPFFEKI